MGSFFRAFVPIFFTVDAIGVLPLFVGLTEGMDRARRQRTVKQSLVTALLVAIAFVLVGKSVFDLLGIRIGHFELAGGAIMFIIATLDLVVSGEKPSRAGLDTIGAVPIGMPLIVGPATLTMSLLLVDLPEVGLAATILALVVNIALAGVVLLSADVLTRLLGKAGSAAVSKVASLLLAAIAVMMVCRGLEALGIIK
jgi:multiple antibiotic resistance protein